MIQKAALLDAPKFQLRPPSVTHASFDLKKAKNAPSRAENFEKNQKTSTLDTNLAEDGAMEVYPVTEVPRSWERDARTRKACNVTPLSG